MVCIQVNTKISFDALEDLVSYLIVGGFEVLNDELGHLLLPERSDTLDVVPHLQCLLLVSQFNFFRKFLEG